MTKAMPGLVLELERQLPAPPERVYRALTSADEVVQWFGPGTNYDCVATTWDCRVGGKWELTITVKEGDDAGKVHVARGEFLELVPGERVVQSWSWKDGSFDHSEVRMELAPAGDGTRFTLRHIGLPDEEQRNSHEHGWSGSLDKLEALVGR